MSFVMGMKNVHNFPPKFFAVSLCASVLVLDLVSMDLLLLSMCRFFTSVRCTGKPWIRCRITNLWDDIKTSHTTIQHIKLLEAFLYIRDELLSCAFSKRHAYTHTKVALNARQPFDAPQTSEHEQMQWMAHNLNRITAKRQNNPRNE